MAETLPVEGCYLLYESDSGGKLVLHYSREADPDAVGFWAPGEGKKIQGFKFNRASGKSELIKGIAGGDANRKKYFSGWCQFLKEAKKIQWQRNQISRQGRRGSGSVRVLWDGT
mmetsp:Transcript_23845/g.30407  ORF Transcript_23845/g.30407 Transcript_23845/m.30407 type:complete len:114 (-) Transcript_23845:313-654(-)